MIPSKVVKRQIAIFPNNYYEEDIYGLFNKLKEIDQFKEGEGKIITADAEAPREIPRIVLVSEDEKYLVEIGFEKISIEIITPQGMKTFDLSSVWTMVEKIYELTISSLTIKRVGYIESHLLSPTNGDIFSIMGNKILSGFTENLTNFYVRLTYRKEIENVERSNQVILIKKVLKEDNESIIVESDINTHQELNVEWNLQDTREFFENAIDETDMNTIVDKYLNNSE